MKKSIIMYSIVFILFYITFVFVCPFSGDEIWNFGFSYNIFSGLIPYLDFNLVTTPFYHFINAFLFEIFSPSIIVMHSFNSFLITCMFIFLDRIHDKALFFHVLFFLLLSPILSVPSYNLFCTIIFILVIWCEYSDKSSFLIGFLIGIIFISKHSIGLLLLIPVFFRTYSNRSKFLLKVIGFIIPIVIFSFYLFFTKSFFAFFNYCFMGMFDFTKNFSMSYLVLFLELFVVILLIVLMFKDKHNKTIYLYLICYQIVVFPILDLYHFIVGIVPVIFFITRNYKFKYINIIMIMLFTLFFITHFKLNITSSKYFNYRVDLSYPFYSSNVFNYIKENKQYDIKIISTFSYYIKIENGLNIDKYDLLFYGNLGYHGYDSIISDIKSFTQDTLFLINPYDINNSQVNVEIVNYIINNSVLIGNIDFFDVYLYEVS